MTDGRRKVRLEEMFPWEIARAMAEAPLCYPPLGTLEWHGVYERDFHYRRLVALLNAL